MHPCRPKNLLKFALLACCGIQLSSSDARAASPAQQALETAAAGNQYAFIVFFKDDGAASQAMSNTVKKGVEGHSGRARLVYVNVTDAQEKPVVERFGVDRAPMPMTVAVAPNGAVTGVYAQTISDERFEKAFVSPGVAHSMKAMQEGKMVFVCVSLDGSGATPPGVINFQLDPDFRNRTALIHISQASQEETELLKQLELDAQQANGATVALLAPPGVLVGKWGVSATKEEIATALHAAGKCCNDPNCKHNKK